MKIDDFKRAGEGVRFDPIPTPNFVAVTKKCLKRGSLKNTFKTKKSS